MGRNYLQGYDLMIPVSLKCRKIKKNKLWEKLKNDVIELKVVFNEILGQKILEIYAFETSFFP